MKKFYYDLSFEAQSEKEAEMKVFSLEQLLPKCIADLKTNGLKDQPLPLQNVRSSTKEEIQLMCFARKIETVGKILQHMTQDADSIDAIADLLGLHDKPKEE
ncbi:MAG: hypothetical protein HY841_03955 [Bacteroidetes bacterium]|nr:hypothetical protein [Bacteroidota bacterium]